MISPASRVRDTVRRARLYAAAGVPELWLPDRERRVLRGGRYVAVEPVAGKLRSEVLPDLVLDVEALFARFD